jgi:hypothetical protein
MLPGGRKILNPDCSPDYNHIDTSCKTGKVGIFSHYHANRLHEILIKMNILELEKKSLADLREQAKELNIQRAARLKKEQLIVKIRQAEAEKEGLEVRGGILEIMNEGIGFLSLDTYARRVNPNDTMGCSKWKL